MPKHTKLDVYRCPAGQLLADWLTTVDGERTIRRYTTKAYGSCPLKARCTTAKNRIMTRWEHEHVMEVAQRRLDADPRRCVAVASRSSIRSEH